MGKDKPMTIQLVPQQAVQLQQLTGPNTAKWGLGGGDLGCMWQSGNSVLHVFGDNFKTVQEPSPFSGPVGTDYRPNCLGRSSSLNLYKGITFDNFNVDANSDRTSILPILSGEDGVVPTGGINVGGVEYMGYTPFSKGHTSQDQTNAGGTATSTDGGKTWARDFNCYWNQNAQLTDPFQQSTFAWDGGTYVYRFTTQSGRGGDIHLLRCPTTGVGTKSAYQYWTGSAWSTDLNQVGVLIPGPVGEMSAYYNDLLGVWVVLYHDDPGQATVMRYAPSPTGPWSAKLSVLNDSGHTPYGIYAPMVHPQSSGTSLFFCGSDWNTYETYLFYANINVTCV